MYANEVETKEKQKLPQIKNQLQYIHHTQVRAAPVFQKVDNAIHWLYPVDSGIAFPNTYPLDSDLSGEYIALSNI